MLIFDNQSDEYLSSSGYGEVLRPRDLAMASPALRQNEGPPVQPMTSFLATDTTGPCQFQPQLWIGSTGALSNPGFFAHNNIKFVISCTSANQVARHYLQNPHCDLPPPEHCVVVVDPSFRLAPTNLAAHQNNDLVLRFISKYSAILSAVINSSAPSYALSDITSPMVAIKDKLSLTENIVNLVSLIRRNFPHSGILIVNDGESEQSKRRSILLAVACIVSTNPMLNILDALIILKGSTVVDDVCLNNENFFNVLDSFRLNVAANQRFHHNRAQGENLKRNHPSSSAHHKYDIHQPSPIRPKRKR